MPFSGGPTLCSFTLWGGLTLTIGEVSHRSGVAASALRAWGRPKIYGLALWEHYLQMIKARTGLSESEQVRQGIRWWLESREWPVRKTTEDAERKPADSIRR